MTSGIAVGVTGERAYAGRDGGGSGAGIGGKGGVAPPPKASKTGTKVKTVIRRSRKGK